PVLDGVVVERTLLRRDRAAAYADPRVRLNPEVRGLVTTQEHSGHCRAGAVGVGQDEPAGVALAGGNHREPGGDLDANLVPDRVGRHDLGVALGAPDLQRVDNAFSLAGQGRGHYQLELTEGDRALVVAGPGQD